MFHEFYVSFHAHGLDEHSAKQVVEESMRGRGMGLQVRDVSMRLVKELAKDRGMAVSASKVEIAQKGMKRCPDCVKSGCSIWYVPDGDGNLQQRVCTRCAGLGMIRSKI